MSKDRTERNLNKGEQIMKRVGIIAAATMLSLGSLAGTIESQGVLGNSGVEGESLVTFGRMDMRTVGMGVVADDQGGLWDRAGRGTLNRYSLDGRLLGQYKMPTGNGHRDAIVRNGKYLVALVRDKLYRLPLDAAPGSKMEQIKTSIKQPEFLAATSLKGMLVVRSRDGKIHLLDPVSGQAAPYGSFEGKYCNGIDVGLDGNLYIFMKKSAHKLVNGQEVKNENWPKTVTGKRENAAARMQRLGDCWLGHTWHGTVKRYDLDLNPAPGVVLGGASGHFIGYVEQNSELGNGQGTAQLGEAAFAFSGYTGIMHLAQWNPETKKMALLRRIGAMPELNCLALDSKGNIWARSGRWDWNAGPLTPQRHGINTAELGQAAMIGDTMVAPSWQYGQPGIAIGTIDKEPKGHRLGKKFDLLRGFVGTAVYPQNSDGTGPLQMLVSDPYGHAQLFEINKSGRTVLRANLGDVQLKTAQKTLRWTTLGLKSNTTLLAAADGQVIEFERDGLNWREVKRWNSWGDSPADSFGKRIYLCAADDRLWVSDTDRQRVLCFNLADGKLLGQFGQTDTAGTSQQMLSGPQIIAASGQRAVVYDATNQRLIKLSITQ
jgi:hypothetical protein